MLSADHILFAIYLLVGPGAMLALIASLALGHSRMKRLVAQRYPLPQSPPSVAILIPAKDEAGKIRECLEAALAQDYPNFQIVAIDDRSSDGTGQILDEIAGASSGKLKVVHISPDGLPEGWAGKVNALHTGVAHTDAPWLFFVDSDVLLQTDALSQLMGISLARHYDAVTLLPRLICNSFLQKLVMPVAAGAWSVMHAISLTNDDRVNVALANGQVFLIRREPYEKVGGHAHPRVRQALAEDVQLMRAIKAAGFKTRFFLGYHIAATRMYSALPQAFRGWARIYATTNELSPWRILLAIAFLVISAISGCAALAWGIYALGHWSQFHWLLGAVLHAVLTVICLMPSYRWSGNPRWGALLFPITVPAMFIILLDALNLCRTGKFIWRGTSYSFRERVSS